MFSWSVHVYFFKSFLSATSSTLIFTLKKKVNFSQHPCKHGLVFMSNVVIPRSLQQEWHPITRFNWLSEEVFQSLPYSYCHFSILAPTSSWKSRKEGVPQLYGSASASTVPPPHQWKFNFSVTYSAATSPKPRIPGLLQISPVDTMIFHCQTFTLMLIRWAREKNERSNLLIRIPRSEINAT